MCRAKLSQFRVVHGGTATDESDFLQARTFAGQELFKTDPFAGEFFLLPPLHDDHRVGVPQD